MTFCTTPCANKFTLTLVFVVPKPLAIKAKQGIGDVRLNRNIEPGNFEREGKVGVLKVSMKVFVGVLFPSRVTEMRFTSVTPFDKRFS